MAFLYRDCTPLSRLRVAGGGATGARLRGWVRERYERLGSAPACHKPTPVVRPSGAGRRRAHPQIHGSLRKLALGAVGVCYGDIGTSPLYAMKEVFVGHHPLDRDLLHIFGVLSLMFWSLLIVVSIKYIGIILRADNKGEGGSLALLALIQRRRAADDGRTAL